MKEKRTRRKSVTITFEGRHRESQQHAAELKEVSEYIMYINIQLIYKFDNLSKIISYYKKLYLMKN